MLRIRTSKDGAQITVTIDTKCANANVKASLEALKGEIADGFDTLAAVYEKFNEVKIDKDGALHCKKDKG